MDSQEEKLQREILAEASKRAQRIVDRAQNDCAAAQRHADDANAKAREERLADAVRQGEMQSRMIIQGLENEKNRLWLEERENCIESLLSEVAATAVHLPSGSPERRQLLQSLLAEAVAALALPEAVVSVAADDLPLVPASVGDCRLTPRASAEITAGVVVSSVDGRCVYDNSIAGRLERMHDDFRRLLA